MLLVVRERESRVVVNHNKEKKKNQGPDIKKKKIFDLNLSQKEEIRIKIYILKKMFVEIICI